MECAYFMNCEIRLRRISENRGGITAHCPWQKLMTITGISQHLPTGIYKSSQRSQRRCLGDIMVFFLVHRKSDLHLKSYRTNQIEFLRSRSAHKVLLANGELQSSAKFCLNGCRRSLSCRREKSSVNWRIYTASYPVFATSLFSIILLVWVPTYFMS